jgi:hypothetical protein
MERERPIQELISALRTLRLQEAELTSQLEEAVTRREREGNAARTAPIAAREEKRNNSRGFPKGDRIWIKNKLHKPANWNNDFEWIEKEGKSATVTEVLTKGPNEQVHFVTDKGVRTWRAPNNVCLLASLSRNDE